MMLLIDADKFNKLIAEECAVSVVNGVSQLYREGLLTAKMLMDRCKTVDAEPVRHGRWIDSNNHWQCSECGVDDLYAFAWDCDTGETSILQDYFCPHCGAKMDN